MRLIPVGECFSDACIILYALLKERAPEESISHKKMPTYEEHCRFVATNPYEAWYLVANETVVGAIYLTYTGEIGIGIFKEKRGNGYAKQAIAELMRLHPGPKLANINPANEKSLALFKSMEFTGPIQVTLSHE